MSVETYSKTLFLLLSFAFVTRVTYNYFTKKKTVRKKNANKDFYEVLLFSYGDEQIKKSKYSRCMISVSMDKLLYYLSQPQYNFDICMYVWTNVDVTNTILKLHYRGVKVRVIIDADMAFTSGSALKKLTKYRIPVRWMKSTNLMHHKFCLADTSSDNQSVSPYVISGSLNWTNQALCGNFENCVVTTQKELIEQYQREFERLWVLFKPIVDKD